MLVPLRGITMFSYFVADLFATSLVIFFRRFSNESSHILVNGEDPNCTPHLPPRERLSSSGYTIP